MPVPKPARPIAATDARSGCPRGSPGASRRTVQGKIPVLSCEAPCAAGEIARLAANFLAEAEPFARACHLEAVALPNAAMARWIEASDQVLTIDGCGHHCQTRLLRRWIDAEKILSFNAQSWHERATDGSPSACRKAARRTAEAIRRRLEVTLRPAPEADLPTKVWRLLSAV